VDEAGGRGPVSAILGDMPVPDDPFLRPDAVDHREFVTDAAIEVLRVDGLAGFSVRAMARWMGITSPALTHRFGSRARLLQIVLTTYTKRWLGWAGWPDSADPCPARLPETPIELHALRVWLALHEVVSGHSRAGDSGLEASLAWARQEERELLGRELNARLDRRSTDAEVDTTYALVEGLRCALAVPAPTLTAERARSLLAAHVGTLGRHPGTRDTGGVTSLDPAIAERLKRSSDGLVPAVVQQHDTGEVLMLGWMDDEALHLTLTTGRATYWSRSRQEYWVKGETSGNRQWVKEVRLDCDGDTLLLKVDQEGPACHTGDRTCFDSGLLALGPTSGA
jgi:phosphoribosyl-AMP cyclohydrolase